jgi:ABC-type multidrug transport system fused ATPase/permease subunit
MDRGLDTTACREQPDSHRRAIVDSSIWSQLRLLLGTQRRTVLALIGGSVLSGLTESALLALIAQCAAAMVSRASRAKVDLGVLHVQAGLGVLFLGALVLVLLRLGLQVVISIAPARIAASLQRQLRTGVLNAFTHAAWGVQARDREGHLQELLTNQVGQAVSASLSATGMVTWGLTFLVLVISAFALNAVAAVILLVTATGLFLLLRPLSNLGRRFAGELSQAGMAYAAGVNEIVRLAEEAQVFGAARAQRARASRLVEAVRGPLTHVQTISRLSPGLYQTFVYLLLVIALLALNTIGGGQLTSLGAVVLLLVRAGMYGQQVQTGYQGMLTALPFLDRLYDAQRYYEESALPTGSLPLQTVESITFDDVSFAYAAGQPVLSNIAFEVEAGEAVGIIGPSGAGKSTLVQLLLGLRLPDSGRYLVNGVPAQQYDRADWHERVAYVPQQPRLLHASVAENIRFFRAIDDAAVERAARLAGIHDDVLTWPHRYETVVGPRADAVSGGQQQRICLARALAANPTILVLDEPTSSLDPHTESLIQQSLIALKQNLTLFVVAHRMSTLDICDRLMIIIDGRLQAIGSVAELRSNSAYYRSVSALDHSTATTLATP